MTEEKNRILLALNDDEEIKAFSGYLAGLGLDITPVKDGARALETAINEVPSLIITELDLPVISGEKFFQIIRKNPHTSKVPFLFISKSIADIRGFRTGADIFLVKPINMVELYGRIRQALTIKDGPATASKEIEGKLSHMPLPDMLQFLHLNRKEGELRVTSAGQRGSIFIKDGQVYNALLEGAEKEKALFRLLQWAEGRFEFIPMSVSITRKIRATTGNLIMEGMRQLDEFKKKRDQLPDPSLPVKARVSRDGLPEGLQPVIYEIINVLKHGLTVGQVVEQCSHPDYEVYQALASMIGRGIVEIQKQDSLKAYQHHEEFLTHDQMISIREKIISRFADLTDTSHGKVLLISTSGDLVNSFVKRCLSIHGFNAMHKTSGPQNTEDPAGAVAKFRLYGGMDLLLFSIPSVKHMGPLWRAFSGNMIGLILLWDGNTASELKELAQAKKELLSKRRVPVVQIYAGANAANEEIAAYRKTLNLRNDEPFFQLGKDDRSTASEVFYSIFSNILKDDYVTV